MSARLTWDQREERRLARWYGKRCALAVDHALFHGREAAAWRQLDAHTGSPTADALTERWQTRSDLNLADAVDLAQRAAHHARLALGTTEDR